MILLSILTSFFLSLEQNVFSSDCVLSVSSEQSQPMFFPGSVVMEGDKFCLSILGMEVAYDGSTMYMYSDNTQELTLTKPSEEDLQQTNPLRFAKALAEVSRVEEKTTKSGNQVITLYPNDISVGIMRVVLTLNKEGKLPVSIEIKEANQVSLLSFTNPILSSRASREKGGKNLSYKIDKPNAFLNDLR